MLPHFPPAQSCVYQITAPLAPPATEIRLAPNEAADFTKGLAALAKIIKGTIVVEGVPLKGRRAEQGTTALSGSASEVLRQFAESYDYGVIRFSEPTADKGAVFLFAKRYTTGNEIPCVTEEEYIATLADVQTALSVFAPDPPLETGQKAVRQIVQSLTGDVKERCLRGGVPISQLPPDTQRTLWRLAADTWLSSMITSVAGTRDSLRRFAATGAVRKANENGIEYHAIDCMMPMGTAQTTEDGSRIITVTGETRYSMSLFPEYRPAPDGDLPAPPPPLSSTIRSDSQIFDSTLGTLMETLNAKEKERHYEALSYLRDKPLTVQGIDNATPASIAEAVARLYGLYIHKTKANDKETWRFQRPALTLVRSPQEVSPAVFKSLPLPLLRATGLLNDLYGPATTQKRHGNSLEAPRVQQGLATGLSNPLDRMSKLRQVCRDIASEGIERQFRKAKATSLRYAALPAYIRSATAAYYIIAHAFSYNEEMIKGAGGLPPAYITQFEESVLTLNTDKEGGAITGFTLSSAHLPQRIGQGSILSITLPE